MSIHPSKLTAKSVSLLTDGRLTLAKVVVDAIQKGTAIEDEIISLYESDPDLYHEDRNRQNDYDICRSVYDSLTEL